MSIYLSPNFTKEELTASQTAARLGLSNEPSPQHLQNLRRAAEQMEQVRSMLGSKPILISSGYRSPAVNKAVGGSAKSHHCEGHAVDFTCPQYGSPLAICEVLAESVVPFDQIIHEYGRWVHISFAPSMRKQLLTLDQSGTRVGLHPII